MKYFLKKFFHAKDVAYRYDQLFDEVKRVKPLRIMEIGVWTGERARKMITLAARYHSAKEVCYYGFDLFEPMDPETYSREVSKQPPAMEEVSQKLKQTGAEIQLIKGNTLATMPQAVEELPKMDLVFIDGGHSLETVANDWRHTEKLLKPGSVVIFDDYWSDRTDAGAKMTVDAIDRGRYDVEILPVVDKFDKTEFGPLAIRFARVIAK